MAVGPTTSISLQQAREKARELLYTAKHRNIDPLDEQKRQASSPTVKDLCDRYIEEYAKPRKKTWKKDQSRIDRHLLPRWESRRVHSITRVDVNKLHDRIGKKTPYEANRVLEMLRVLFDKAVDYGYLPEGAPNPARSVKKFPEEARTRRLLPDELPRLAEAINAEPDIQVRIAIWLYLLIGVRKTELLSAKRSQLNLDGKELHIPTRKKSNKLSKKTQYLIVHVPDPAARLIEALPHVANNPYLFPGRKHGSHRVNIDKNWRRIRSEAGVDDVRIHDLRRTVGSWLGDQGTSGPVVQKALGHASYSSTTAYIHLSNVPVRKAMDSHTKKVIAVAGEHSPVDIKETTGGTARPPRMDE